MLCVIQYFPVTPRADEAPPQCPPPPPPPPPHNFGGLPVSAVRAVLLLLVVGAGIVALAVRVSAQTTPDPTRWVTSRAGN